ncbi:MAG: glycosyltransferase family 2 protein [Gammaproteobacteria bacterium]|nr:glycosyltransferase family 2 protein [Gammaproteobacteria bacterium]
MSVAVIIVNYNSGEYLSRCLDSIAAQTLAPSRVLVIDNASVDGSSQRAATQYPNVEFTRNDDNLGFAAANNQGLEKLAKGGRTEFVALLNPDAFADPKWLQALVSAAGRHPGAASFASRMMVAGQPDVLDGFGDVYHVSGLAWRRYHGRTTASVVLAEEPVFGACAGAALYRLDSVLEVGGFDEDLFCYVEDVDLAFRLQLAGFACVAVPNAVVDHVGKASSLNRPEFPLFYGHRNLIWVYVTNMPAAWLIATLPLHVLVNALGLVSSMFRGDGRVVARAQLEALRGLKVAVAKRRAGANRDVRLWPVISKSLTRCVRRMPSR